MENDKELITQPGLTFLDDGSACVMLWTPHLQGSAVYLPEKNLTLPLSRGQRGYWQLITTEIQPGDHYQILTDDGRKLPDPASLSQPQGVHGPSQAIDLNEFEWSDEAWQNPLLEEYIIYELHTGTFTVEGNFEAIKSKLPYLKELGITALEIMPVAQFPGDRNWGYDGVFPYAVQNSYGGAKELMSLVNACHDTGIAVILDVVYNHIGPEGNYLPAFGPYFTDKYHTPWGNAVNFDDAHSDEVRHYFTQNALMWFRDFHIDALRMDAVHAIKDLSPKHILQEIREAVDELMDNTGKTHYLIVECDLNDRRFIDPIKQSGYGMDAQWIDEFHHSLRVAAGGERNGYYSEFNGIGHLAKSYRDAYVYDGVYSEGRAKTFGTKTDNPGRQFVVFSQNHDQVGNRMLGERSSTLFSFETQKLLAGAVMVSPYLPMLFMGEEYGEDNPFLYFVSHTDEELIAAVRKGRKAEFASFHTEGEAPDPQSVKTFERSKLNWNSLDDPQHKVVLGYYKTLIEVRKQLPALHKLNRNQLNVEYNEEQQTLQLHRWEGAQHVYCLMNFSEEQRSTTLPLEPGKLKLILNSADARWNGPEQGLSPTVIQPQSIIIYIN
ncbi:malto-oligosyltrehalose trehalohydrolase [Mucilaginibacter aquariorum]|uniref:Malto-oligosyltrehalose trehalohydrolase n=1 Tax=Mucilaginibacter aquariorum TaxID=2967225 RepID=A0ABT1SVR6_9SPHI|nr:malto-oligosyltrehalose trehalohydrolase [Mucilaginibacter aquariorum]MCQ6956445.1 malto-oligosyltrehalose trehalohydrolase [Mucilaginibacter aquariorum]